ncbi:MAG: permease [Sphaerochaeta sp.]|nr:permease [Sphaerochaeta sp.]
MKILLKKYRNLLVMVVILLGVTVFNLDFGKSVARITTMQLKEMALVIPPVFILLGLLDVWISKETMSRYMGEGSGLKGILLSILIGSAAAGPLYGAFPVAAVFMKKGVAFRNILIFIGAWSTTKIPMLLFEIASLGPRFALTRLLVDIPGIILIACILTKLISKDEVKRLYERMASE